MKQSATVGGQLLWGGRYGCNNGRYGCTIVMSYIEINKAVSQWLLTFNLCVSVTLPLTCAFHIPCPHTPEIIDIHRGVCDNVLSWTHLDEKFCCFKLHIFVSVVRYEVRLKHKVLCIPYIYATFDKVQSSFSSITIPHWADHTWHCTIVWNRLTYDSKWLVPAARKRRRKNSKFTAMCMLPTVSNTGSNDSIAWIWPANE